jgi:membrane-bound serine protease (ClpP class)
VNDAASYGRSLAAMRGRNADWAEEAVRRSSSLDAEEAFARGVVDLLADGEAALLDSLEGRSVILDAGIDTLRIADSVVRKREASFVERLLAIIADPNVAYLLFLAGILGIFFELSNPGVILPGVVGGIALILALFAFQSLPVSTAGILLILLSLVLFVVEVKVMSHGVLAIGGTVSLLLGSMMLFRNGGATLFRLSWWVMVPALLVTASFFLIAVGLAIRAQGRRVSTGREGMIGIPAVVLDSTHPDAEGKVRIRGEIWAARSSEAIPAGSRVRVVSVDGLVVTVAPEGRNAPEGGNQ